MSWPKRHFEGEQVDLDSPEINARHGALARSKPLLRRWYEEQYAKYASVVSRAPRGVHVELGSGGGFLKEVLPGVITSSPLKEDVLAGRADRTLDARRLDLADASVDSLFLLDVLHHLNDARSFFREASRVLKPGGVVLMIDPANTLLSRFVYKNFHHEAFDERSLAWGHSHAGPLADGNQAISWIVFERDRAAFEREFPELRIEGIRKHTFLAYILSGGMTYEELVPAWARGLVPWLEAAARPLMPLVAQSMDVRLVKAR